jgi:uncharacterized protein (TIGR04141 family)
MEEGNLQEHTSRGQIHRSNSNETFELAQQELIAPMSDTEDGADDENDLDRQLREDFGDASVKRKLESSQAPVTKKQASAKRWVVALLKPDVDPKDAIKKGIEGISSYSLKDNLPGTMYIKSNPIKQLFWVPTIQSYIDPQQSVSGMTGEATRVESAVMFMTAESRRFAIIYGKGRTMLDPQKLENEFGLRVALNAVDPNKILRLSEKTLETNSRSTTTIYAAPTELYKFQPERYGALIKGITAQISQDEANIDNSRANYTLSGNKAFVSFSQNLDLKGLPATLKGLLDHYNSQEYQKKFPWFDDIRPLDNDDLVVPTLHTELLKAVKDPSTYLLCEPWHELMEQESEGEGYRVTFTKSKVTEYSALVEAFNAMQDYMKTDKALSLKTLGGKKIERLGEGEEVITSWTWYDSIALVLPIKNEVYALHEGSWFKINSNYAAGIDSRVNKLLLADLDYAELLKSQHKEPEGKYLRRVVKKTPNELLLMDQRCVTPEVSHATQIEVCDLLYQKQEQRALIHVKRKLDSSLLSHLFNQGVVSGKNLKLDPLFRQKAQDKFTQAELIEWLESSDDFEKFSDKILKSKPFQSQPSKNDKIVFILEKYTQHIKGKKIQESSFKTKDATKRYNKSSDKDKALFDILNNHLLDALGEKLGQISSALTGADRDQKLREQWGKECPKILGKFLKDEIQKQIPLQLEAWQKKISDFLPKEPFNPQDYQVVFGIITDKENLDLSETLPFFSRITLDNAATELQNMGYSVGVKLIGF